MARTPLRLYHLALLYFFGTFGSVLLGVAPCGFGQVKQEPLGSVRERTGIAIRTKARGMDSFPLTKQEKLLLSKIASASDSRDWSSAQSFFATYTGEAIQIFAATLNAAFRCSQYSEGAKVYDQCKKRCKFINKPSFSAALRIFGKLGDTNMVREVWTDALAVHEVDHVLASARICAAADEGDVETAAQVLDILNSGNVKINVYHVNAAMRACWGWGNKQHKAAKYLFGLIKEFELTPTVVSFTSLIGSYRTAALDEFLAAYRDMKNLQIPPDSVFAEIYVVRLLKLDSFDGAKRKSLRSRLQLEQEMRQIPAERLEAAKDASSDFKTAGLQLTGLCKIVDSNLKRLA